MVVRGGHKGMWKEWFGACFNVLLSGIPEKTMKISVNITGPRIKI
jgi:hypothetical protein